MSQTYNTFDIVIDFRPSEGDPARVFKAMSGLVDSFQELDRHLASSIDASLETQLLLEDVERGSLKARFGNFIEGIPDEALKDGDWKKLAGHFLLRSKYKILEWCSDRDEISDRLSVDALEGELLVLAEESNIKQLPAYAPIRAETLLSDIQNVQNSLVPLISEDKAIYSADQGIIEFNRDLIVSEEVVRDVLTREVVKTSSKRILKVKKPDYLGQSMWGFVHDGRAIDAKVTDQDWLLQFQNRGVDVKPGDSIRAMLYEEISYGYEGEIVHRHYEVENIYEIIKPPRQGKMGI